MSTIFDGNTDSLGEYIRALADRMGLRDWHFTLMPGNPPGNADFAAEIEVTRFQPRGAIYVHESWPQWEPHQLRQTIAHELMHAHLKALEYAIDPINTIMGELGATPIIHAHHAALEYAIECMSIAWAETLPLPDHWREIESGE